ncbi:hypothetical protein LX64_00466 [Chitinophaga skermanii]|uniref:Uncharacterized protein n=1 Tax=Chitinophaga skermanii TaxID=331697 RepID=A0A327R1Y0_9BACT|nr:hypothetical protein [Chitinophaga skermanii]RAJ10859.1 hypothetical protein LX64_00466 [Chitinophaga skermanii]
MLKIGAERSLIFKALLGWIYLSFFCVQLHFKYVVAFDAINRTSHVISVEKKSGHTQVGQAKNTQVKIVLNKRYQPEAVYTLPVSLVPTPIYHPSNFAYQVEVGSFCYANFTLQLSLRGPPAC